MLLKIGRNQARQQSTGRTSPCTAPEGRELRQTDSRDLRRGPRVRSTAPPVRGLSKPPQAGQGARLKDKMAQKPEFSRAVDGTCLWTTESSTQKTFATLVGKN